MAVISRSSVWPPPLRSVGWNVFLILFCRVVAVTMIRSPTRQSRHGSSVRDRRVARLCRPPELDPGAASGAPWKSIRPPQQTMRRAGVLVHSLEIRQPNHGRFPAGIGDRPLCRLPGPARVACVSAARQVGLAVEAFFAEYDSPAATLSRPTFSSVSRSRAKRERAADLDRADRLVGLHVVGHRVARPDQHSAPAEGTLPPSQVATADQGPLLAERIRSAGAAWPAPSRARPIPATAKNAVSAPPPAALAVDLSLPVAIEALPAFDRPLLVNVRELPLLAKAP